MELNVVTSAFPFVPAHLHMGNIGSTYLPADICCRMLKAFGLPAVHVSATDVHSILASGDGKSISPEMCDAFHREYRDIFRQMGICFDNYIRTDDAKHISQVYQVIDDLTRARVIQKQQIDDITCEGCGVAIPVRLLENGKCPYCGSDALGVHQNVHYTLCVAAEQHWLQQQVDTYNQHEIRNSFRAYCEEGLKDWDFTRVNSYGLRYPGDSELAIYLWFESLVGYLSAVSDFKADSYRFSHFFGKNIIYYHSVIWPIFLKYTWGHVNTAFGLSARGFLQLKQSDERLMDIQQALGFWDADMLRFYLSYKIRDDIRDYSFKVRDFENVIRKHLIHRICNLNYRAFYIVKAAEPEGLPDSGWEFEEIRSCVEDLRRLLEGRQIHGMLERILSFADLCNKRLTLPDFRDPKNPENIAFLLRI